MPAAFIAGCAGVSLSADERAFFRDSQPTGLILFQRNCQSPRQVRRLTDEFRSLMGHDPVVLVDQEGGRVQRMAPPNWRALPAARAYAKLYETDRTFAISAARTVARLCAHDLKEAGINMNCVPVLDVPSPDGHEIIGTRAYGRDVAAIVALGEAVAQGHMDGGVSPVMKHMPGHGRATADSHLELPQVAASLAELERADLEPFRRLSHLPAGMTAHVVYTALDERECASTSATVIADTIRGYIGFDGFLMSDDLSMKALSGDMSSRVRRVLQAGCDVALHCNGAMEEMMAVAEAAPDLDAAAKRRFEKLSSCVTRSERFALEEAEAILAKVLTMENA